MPPPHHHLLLLTFLLSASFPFSSHVGAHAADTAADALPLFVSPADSRVRTVVLQRAVPAAGAAAADASWGLSVHRTSHEVVAVAGGALLPAGRAGVRPDERVLRVRVLQPEGWTGGGGGSSDDDGDDLFAPLSDASVSVAELVLAAEPALSGLWVSARFGSFRVVRSKRAYTLKFLGSAGAAAKRGHEPLRPARALASAGAGAAPPPGFGRFDGGYSAQAPYFGDGGAWVHVRLAQGSGVLDVCVAASTAGPRQECTLRFFAHRRHPRTPDASVGPHGIVDLTLRKQQMPAMDFLSGGGGGGGVGGLLSGAAVDHSIRSFPLLAVFIGGPSCGLLCEAAGGMFAAAARRASAEAAAAAAAAARTPGQAPPSQVVFARADPQALQQSAVLRRLGIDTLPAFVFFRWGSGRVWRAAERGEGDLSRLTPELVGAWVRHMSAHATCTAVRDAAQLRAQAELVLATPAGLPPRPYATLRLPPRALGGSRAARVAADAAATRLRLLAETSGVGFGCGIRVGEAAEGTVAGEEVGGGWGEEVVEREGGGGGGGGGDVAVLAVQKRFPYDTATVATGVPLRAAAAAAAAVVGGGAFATVRSGASAVAAFAAAAAAPAVAAWAPRHDALDVRLTLYHNSSEEVYSEGSAFAKAAAEVAARKRAGRAAPDGREWEVSVFNVVDVATAAGMRAAASEAQQVDPAAAPLLALHDARRRGPFLATSAGIVGDAGNTSEETARSHPAEVADRLLRLWRAGEVAALPQSREPAGGGGCPRVLSGVEHDAVTGRADRAALVLYTATVEERKRARPQLAEACRQRRAGVDVYAMDMEGNEAGRGGSTLAPLPGSEEHLFVLSAAKSDAHGAYRRHGGTVYRGYPVWESVDRRGRVLYTDATGRWVVGLASDMQVGGAWVCSDTPHNGTDPTDVERWRYWDGDHGWRRGRAVKVVTTVPTFRLWRNGTAVATCEAPTVHRAPSLKGVCRAPTVHVGSLERFTSCIGEGGGGGGDGGGGGGGDVSV